MTNFKYLGVNSNKIKIIRGKQWVFFDEHFYLSQGLIGDRTRVV